MRDDELLDEEETGVEVLKRRFGSVWLGRARGGLSGSFPLSL
jgi:hypothetical protein